LGQIGQGALFDEFGGEVAQLAAALLANPAAQRSANV
jgi:hypothetical protein